MARYSYGRRRNPWSIAFLILMALILGVAIGYFFFFRKGGSSSGKDRMAMEAQLPIVRKNLEKDLDILERAARIHEEGIGAAELLRRFIAKGGGDSDSLLTAYHQLFVMPELPRAELPLPIPLTTSAPEWAIPLHVWYAETLSSLTAIQKNRSETQFFRTFYPLALDWIANNQWFDEEGRLVGFRPAPRFNASLDKYRMLNLLDRMVMGRRYARKAVVEALEEGKELGSAIRKAESGMESRE